MKVGLVSNTLEYVYTQPKINFTLAIKLARYFIETKTVAKNKSVRPKVAKCSILEFKLRKFAGKYDQILNKHIDLVLFDFSH